MGKKTESVETSDVEVEYFDKIKKLDELIAQAEQTMGASQNNQTKIVVEQVQKVKRVPVFDEKMEDVPYCKIKFRNIFEPRVGASFTYEGVPVRIKDGEEKELKKEIVDHLNSLIIKKPRRTNVNGQAVDVMEEIPRYSCVVLSEYTKQEKVKRRVA